MPEKDWIQSVAYTAADFPYSSFNYLEGRPFDSMSFAGMEQFHVIDRAFIDPYGAESVGLLCYGGLSDRSGTLPIYAYHLRVNRRAQFVIAGRRTHVEAQAEDPEYIPGRWLYGGELMHHFGHFMSESSHRAYAVTEYLQQSVVDDLDGIIFASRAGLKGYARDLFCGYYGIPEDRIRIVQDRTAIVEHLEIRPQGAILGGSALSPQYMDFLNFHQEQNSRSISREFPRRLFLGRAHLTTGGGGIADEQVLETHLAERGFISVRPEEYPLLEQLEMLRQAEMVVGIGGSFVHLYDHLGETETAMFLVSRGDRDSFYHDRSVRSKVASLTYYQPDTDRGDAVEDFDEAGRHGSVTKYNMEALLAEADLFIKAHE